MLVHPAPGLIVLRPDTNTPLPANGADVPDQDWCLRRLRDGDVLPGLLSTTPPTPATPATSFAAALSASSGPINTGVTLTLTLPPNTTWPAGTTLTPAASGLTGTFVPTAASPVGNLPASFAFTPAATGSGTLTATASPDMTTGPVAYQATAVGTAPTPPPPGAGIATNTTPGLVKGGGNVTIASDGTMNAPAGASVTVGTAAGTVAAGNDARIVSAQTAAQVASAVTAGIATVVGAAPTALDTLVEIAAKLTADESGAATLAALVSGHTTLLAAQAPRIPTGNAGAANGAAVLGNDGKVPAAQLPAQAGSTAPAPTSRVVTATGPVTIVASDAGGSVFINKTASEPTTVTLLAGVPVTILDGKGDAATSNITILPPSGGKIVGQNSIVISGNYDSLTFVPVPNSNNFGIR